jgi:hypothetical protein
MRGSISGPLWQAQKRGIVTNASGRKDFRVWQNKVYVIPAPTSVQTLVIEYIRNTPWLAVDGTTYRAIPTVDTDTTVFPEYLLELELLWRWRHAKGLDYSEEQAEAERQANIAYAQDTPSRVLNFGMSSNRTPTFVANLPQQI